MTTHVRLILIEFDDIDDDEKEKSKMKIQNEKPKGAGVGWVTPTTPNHRALANIPPSVRAAE